jgi:hypothetical protein
MQSARSACHSMGLQYNMYKWTAWISLRSSFEHDWQNLWSKHPLEVEQCIALKVWLTWMWLGAEICAGNEGLAGEGRLWHKPVRSGHRNRRSACTARPGFGMYPVCDTLGKVATCVIVPASIPVSLCSPMSLSCRPHSPYPALPLPLAAALSLILCVSVWCSPLVPSLCVSDCCLPPSSSLFAISLNSFGVVCVCVRVYVCVCACMHADRPAL